MSDRQQEMQKQDETIQETLSGIGKKYLVMSGKGGVGKTTVAVNLAVGLANRGHKVGLIDVDLHGPNTLKMLGLEGSPLKMEGESIMPLAYSDRLSVVSISSMLADQDTAVIWRGPLKIQIIRQFISDVAWGALDYLVVDAPPGTGDEPLTVAQVVKDAEGIIVTTPQAVAIMDIRKSLSFCREVSMTVAGIIENMSGFSCPHCGKPIELFPPGGGQAVAEEAGVPFLGAIPLDPAVVRSGDEGRPFESDSGATSEAFRTVVEALLSGG